MGGEKIVGFGSDFDGIECTPDDVRNAAQVPNILRELERLGYSQAAIADIAGGNFCRYYRHIG